MRPIRLLLIVLAGLAAFSCGRPAVRDAGVEWIMRDQATSWSADSTDTLKNVRIVLRYPEFIRAGTTAAADTLNRWVQTRLFHLMDEDPSAPSLEGLAWRLITNYREFRSDLGSEEAAPWSLDTEIEVTWDSLNVVSMTAFTESYLGGVHGNAERYWTLHDATSGQRLRLLDLIAPAAMDSLRHMGEAAFLAAREIAPGTPLAKAGFTFEGGAFQLPPEFGIGPEGLLFVYHACEVAPCTFGPTEFVLPWRAVRPLLSRDGPLAALRRD